MVGQLRRRCRRQHRPFNCWVDFTVFFFGSTESMKWSAMRRRAWVPGGG